MAGKGGSWQGDSKPNLLTRPPLTRPKDHSLPSTKKNAGKQEGK